MGRTVEFVPNGVPIRVSASDVIDAWPSSRVPAQYAVGTATHESNFATNEIDTEESGFVSLGIFQLSREECAQAGLPEAKLLDLTESSRVMSIIANKRLDSILGAVGIDSDITLTDDVWAYLALAHNQGLMACLKTIRAHGLDWNAYKQRNPAIKGIGPYGDDCMTGGPSWPFRNVG